MGNLSRAYVEASQLENTRLTHDNLFLTRTNLQQCMPFRSRLTEEFAEMLIQVRGRGGEHEHSTSYKRSTKYITVSSEGGRLIMPRCNSVVAQRMRTV